MSLGWVEAAVFGASQDIFMKQLSQAVGHRAAVAVVQARNDHGQLEVFQFVDANVDGIFDRSAQQKEGSGVGKSISYKTRKKLLRKENYDCKSQ